MPKRPDKANPDQFERNRILIIDDEALIRRSLADYLADCGYETVAAPDGVKGLAQAQAESFAAVLIDLRMPHMDGLKVIKTLKNEQPELPLVVVSGTGILNDALEAIRHGAWDYVTKPIQDMGEIEMVVERVLEKARLRSERDRYQRELEQLNRLLETEVARQVESLQTQNRQLTALNRVAHAISAPLDLDTMLNRAIDAAISAVAADGGAVWLLDTPDNQLRVAAACNIPNELLEAYRTISPGTGLIGTVAQDGHPHTGDDFPGDSWVRALQDAGFYACLGIPLGAVDEADRKRLIVGTLHLVTRTRHSFDTHQIELLTTIGNQIGVAVARAQYALNLKQTNIQLELLLAQVQEQADQVQQIINTVPEGVLLLDTEKQIILTNPAAAGNLSLLTQATAGDTVTQLGEIPIEKLLNPPPQGQWHEISRGNRHFEIVARIIQSGPTPGWVLVIRDVTEEHEIERHIHQQERLAAVGQLAAGIAHDFNNLLTVITGYTELLLHRFANKNLQAYKDIEQIHKAGERAAALTRKLLVFSRQQVIQPEIIDLNHVITDVNEMLHRLISEDIELTIILDPLLGRIQADLSQIEQIILNLTLNACDAMPLGGKLTIKTANIEVSPQDKAQPINLEPGPYVILTVSDTGVGMDPQILVHIFEPFFTTKAQGKGTGLGLATVYGIVQQNQGDIAVTSQTGKGTTFDIYLPRLKDFAQAIQQNQAFVETLQGTETILLVEDEEMVRELACYALMDRGYQVLEAGNGQQALQIAQQHNGPIHLLLTDVVMPGGVSGRQLAETLVTRQPNLKVLFMSGYADDTMTHHGVLAPHVAFLQKPFTPASLAQKVRKILDDSK
jgi:signal transduction histidine kinase/DNA-binding response OmpR family regulator